LFLEKTAVVEVKVSENMTCRSRHAMQQGSGLPIEESKQMRVMGEPMKRFSLWVVKVMPMRLHASTLHEAGNDFLNRIRRTTREEHHVTKGTQKT
jgi:hypothetical protein